MTTFFDGMKKIYKLGKTQITESDIKEMSAEILKVIENKLAEGTCSLEAVKLICNRMVELLEEQIHQKDIREVALPMLGEPKTKE